MSELGIKRGCAEGPDHANFSALSTLLPCKSPAVFCFQAKLNPVVQLLGCISAGGVNKTLQKMSLKEFGLVSYLQ